ncbi:MAG: radical SAM protein [Candidatus Omnitrophota bacterium]
MRNHKILLINTSVVTIKQYKTSQGYPLGVMSIAAYLRENGYPDVTIIDFNEPGKYEQLGYYLEREKPDVVGLSGLSIDQECIHSTAQRVKDWNSDCLVVCGGPYPSASWKRILSDGNLDIAIIGEGELTFIEILDKFYSGITLENIKGTAFRTELGEIKKAVPREPIMDLDRLPYPAYDMINLDHYGSVQSMAPVGERPYISLFTSRACPYQCTYCHDIFGKTFRAMSAEKLVEQIEYYIAQYGIRDFEIYDDIWNLDRNRVRRFCEIVVAKGLKISFHFPNAIRMDIMDEELLTLVKKAGCVFMAVAVESASKKIQKEIKKNNKIGKIKQNIAITDKVGIFSMGYFMIGFPNETYREILQTCYFMVTSRLTTAIMFSVTPFEGTKLFEETGSCADQSFKMEEYVYGDYKLSKVPKWLIRATISVSYTLFYFNPVRVYKIFQRFPNRKYLLEKFYLTVKKLIVGVRFTKGRAIKSRLNDVPKQNLTKKAKPEAVTN